MITSTSRSRLYELRRDRVAAIRSAELLDRKREVLLHETSRRVAQREALRAAVADAYARATHLLAIARVELGSEAIAAAGLAQPEAVDIEQRAQSVMGVHVHDLAVTTRPFRPVYGAASTTRSLDDAARAFHGLVPELLRLAVDERAVSRLRMALRKTTKLVNALQKIVIPRMEREIRTTVDCIEEEERDEGVRRKMRMRAAT
jgi:V/A-type H+/Na+-transporting ATPase subunit D